MMSQCSLYCLHVNLILIALLSFFPSLNLFFCGTTAPNGAKAAQLLMLPDNTHGHTHTHHLVELLCMSDQLVSEAATYTRHNTHKRIISVPSAGFEPTITAIKGFRLTRQTAWPPGSVHCYSRPHV